MVGLLAGNAAAIAVEVWMLGSSKLAEVGGVARAAQNGLQGVSGSGDLLPFIAAGLGDLAFSRALNDGGRGVVVRSVPVIQGGVLLGSTLGGAEMMHGGQGAAVGSFAVGLVCHELSLSYALMMLTMVVVLGRWLLLGAVLRTVRRHECDGIHGGGGGWGKVLGDSLIGGEGAVVGGWIRSSLTKPAGWMEVLKPGFSPSRLSRGSWRYKGPRRRSGADWDGEGGFLRGEVVSS